MEENTANQGISYTCFQCKKNVSFDQLAMMMEIKCPNCGYRVLRKKRSSVVKRVKSI